MLYHACQPISGTNGSRSPQRVDTACREPWQAFSGGSPRQLVREALVGEAPACHEPEGVVRLHPRTLMGPYLNGRGPRLHRGYGGSTPLGSTAPVVRSDGTGAIAGWPANACTLCAVGVSPCSRGAWVLPTVRAHATRQPRFREEMTTCAT